MEDQLGYFKEKNEGQARGSYGRTDAPKNRTAAPVQITAEQILREAHEHKELAFRPPTQKITDPAELADYRMRKRKEFEDSVRRTRSAVGVWLSYATWESAQHEFDRARSVFERALDVDYRNQSIWLRYAEMEMKNKFINSARNVWDRAVSLLPRVDQFWFKYIYMEEMLNNIAGARQIFERWMGWKPEKAGWHAYIKMEIRHKNFKNARGIYERYLMVHMEVNSYVRYAKFEEKHGEVEKSRRVLERAMEELDDDANDPDLFIYFAQFEERHKEFERARVIFKYALDHIPKHKADEVYKMYTSFEKKHGDREGVEQVILSKRRYQYEELLKEDPRNYDLWFDYVRLEEGGGEQAKIRTVFERAISHVPPVAEKQFWRRYIYLWLNFAVYEEIVAKDMLRTQKVYEKCLEIIPHTEFTFSKVWVMLTQFFLRQKNLEGARKVMGTALGRCPREKLFKTYIDFELQLGNVDRCRKLYGKYLEFMPENCMAWSKFAELEATLQESERVRGVFELAIQQPVLDMPEVLWKSYIDYEIKVKDYNCTRKLYERLLDRTKHVKVWVSFAQFEASLKETVKSRAIFDRAYEHFKASGEKEERMMLVEGWKDFEKNFGSSDTLANVVTKVPKRIKKRRLMHTDDGTEAGWEEYYDFMFADDANTGSNLKILEAARNFKDLAKKTKMDDDSDSDSDSSDDDDDDE